MSRAVPLAPVTNRLLDRLSSKDRARVLASCEEVGHLADIVFRRTTLAVLGEVTRPLLADIAGIIAPILGWSDVQTREEIAAVVERLNSRHGGRL